MANAATQTFFSAAELAQANTKKTLAVIHKFHRARWGLYGATYNAITSGKISVPKFTASKFSGEQIDDLAQRGETIEASISSLFDKTPKFVRQATPCGIATTIGILPKRNNTAKAEVKEEVKPAKKATKKATKKPVAKQTAAIVKTPKVVKAEAKPARHIAYWENVKAYDADASEDIVRKIVNHCGIALNNKDAKFVSCSDETERNTVRDSWLVRKLGLSANTETLDAKVLAVCETMKADRMKCRVTFYYLLAKAEGKLNTL